MKNIYHRIKARVLSFQNHIIWAPNSTIRVRYKGLDIVHDLAQIKGETTLQGEFEFGEDPPGIRVFDIQIEELRADAAFPCT